jgi:hypothetical protein
MRKTLALPSAHPAAPPALSAILAVTSLSLLAGCGAPAALVGSLRSTGGELGSFDFSPTRCIARPELGDLVVDMIDARTPGVVVRVNVEKPGTLIANTRAASGAVEVSFAPSATCAYHFGYDKVLTHIIPTQTYQRLVGLRLDCATPAGGHVSGIVGAGACQ